MKLRDDFVRLSHFLKNNLININLFLLHGYAAYIITIFISVDL